jgi:uncharacterized phage-associated protein
MPNYLPVVIANEFLKRHSGTSIPAQMQLQKLVYIAHGWNLAINAQPLVSESPEAWDNGPVFRSLWDHIRDWGFGAKTKLLEEPFDGKVASASLSKDEMDVIDHVWKKYGQYNGLQLSRMTHEPNTPWTATYFARGRNQSIPNDETKKHYIQLAMAGRDRA